MEVLELVRKVRPDRLKVNYMHGKPHDLLVSVQRIVKGTQLDAVTAAESLASLWAFCSYEIIPVKSGYWQVQVSYQVKSANFFLFVENYTSQYKENLL